MKTSKKLIVLFILGLFSFCPIINAKFHQKSHNEVEIQGANQNIYTGRWRVGYHVDEFNEPQKDKPYIYINSISGERGQIIIDKSGRVTINSTNSFRLWKLLIKNTKTNVVTKISFIPEDELMAGYGNNNFFIKKDKGKLIEILDAGESILLSMSNDKENILFRYGETKYLKIAIRTYFNMNTEEMNKLFMLSNDDKIASQKINKDEKQKEVELKKENQEESEDKYKTDLANRKASFPGGKEELRKYLAKKIQYPTIAQEMGIQGTVCVSVDIDESGYIDKENITVAKSVNPYLDKELIRAVTMMPKWEPAVKDGHFVSQKETLSFSFKLY